MNESLLRVGIGALKKCYTDYRNIACETDNVMTMATKCLNGDCTPAELRSSVDILKLKINKAKRIHERVAKAYGIIERALD